MSEDKQCLQKTYKLIDAEVILWVATGRNPEARDHSEISYLLLHLLIMLCIDLGTLSTHKIT